MDGHVKGRKFMEKNDEVHTFTEYKERKVVKGMQPPYHSFEN